MDQETVAATGVSVESALKKVYAPRLCVKCGKDFEPNSANQKKCGTCAAKQVANTQSQKASRARKEVRATKEAGKWNSQAKVTKSRAKEILTERGIKNPHVIDLLWDLYEAASQHFKVPLNEFLFQAGLRTSLAAIEQKKQLDGPVVEDGFVLGESGLCVETLWNKDLHAIWDASLFREPNVTYEQFKQTRYRAKTDAYFLGKELLSRDFSKCHREWVNNFYPLITPDGLVPEYTQAQAKDWWSAQVASQPREYLQLASRSSFKSSTAVVFLISIILQFADVRCLLVSEVSSLSKSFIKSLRHFFEDPTSRFAQYFPEHQISPGDTSVLTYATPMARLGLPQPAAHAIGMDSSAQGLRANIVLVDDPISVLTVANEPQRQASLEKYLMLKNVRERDGLAFLVGTPYHPQDLFKTIIDLNEKDSDGSFRYRIDPAFTVKPHAKTWPLQGLGPDDVDLLFEEQLPFNELKRSLKSNQRFFESQQLCRFVEIEETVKLNFDRAMLTKCIIPNAAVPLEGTVYIFGDTAVSTSARADNSALAVCKLSVNPEGEKTIYVLDMVVGRFRGSELALQLVELTKKWSPHSVTLEKPLTWDLLAGEVSRLGQKYQVHVPIFWSPVSNVKNAKLMRLKGLEITMNAGFFKFVSGLYLEILFNELERLSGDHTSSYRSTTKRDDQADALSIAQKFLLPASASNSEQAKENEELRELQRKQALMHRSYQHYFGSPPQQLPEPSAPVEQDPGHPFDRAGFSKFGFTRAA